MKHRYGYNFEREKERQSRSEDRAGGFKCTHCKQWVGFDPYMGTNNRNHCNVCLWSKHVDQKKGDRKASCHGGMKPIGLTFKQEGYGRQGEIMLVHYCCSCQKISINRVARDDIESNIISVFEASLHQDKTQFVKAGIRLLNELDRNKVMTQLFGK